MGPPDLEAPSHTDPADFNSVSDAASISKDGKAVRRTGTYLELEESTPINAGFRGLFASLTWPIWLLLVLSFIDVLIVWAYCGWSVNRPGGSVEESLHIALSLAITAAFFFYFVVDGIITENAFELLAAVLLDALVLARVLFYIIAKKRREFPGRIVLLSFITIFQVVVLLLAAYTVLQFGWRIFSRLAIDFRKKDAQQRTRLYLSKALFRTLGKLDLQFLAIMTTVAIVIWVKNTDCHLCGQKPSWLILAYNCVLLFVNVLVAAAAWFALKFPDKLRRTFFVDFPLMPISFIQPIANIIWIFNRTIDVQHAKASMAVVCGLFILVRLAIWIMMHLVKHYAEVVNNKDQGETSNLAGKDGNLEVLMRGAWLGKPTARKPNKRRFFQLSADGASLRWSWRKYVRLFYLEAMDCNKSELTLTLRFTTDADLTLKFDDKAQFKAWQVGLEGLVGALMSPGAAPMGGHTNLVRPSMSASTAPAATSAAGRRANRTFLASMVGIIIRDHGPSTSSRSDDIEAALPSAKQAATGVPPQGSPTRTSLDAPIEEEPESPTDLKLQARRQSFDPVRLFDFGDDDILTLAPEGKGLMRLQSGKKAPALFSLPSGVRGGALEAVLYDDLEFGKLLGAGAEGEVYAAWWKDSMVAVKRFNRAEDSIHELRMHTAVSSAGPDAGVVPLRGYCRRDNAVFLIMDFFPRGTLDALIHNTAGQRAWGMDKLLPMVRSTAAGVRTLHGRARPVLHRDLKPGNLFLGANQRVQLGDFGMSRYVDLLPAAEEGGPPQLVRLTPNVIGTAQYAAPELMNEDLLEVMSPQQRYLQADVYSFGVTLWEMLERKRPYKGMDPYQIQTLSIINPEELRLPLVTVPDKLDTASRTAWRALSALVDDCTVTAANQRPNIDEVYSIICRIEDSYHAQRDSETPKNK